MVDHAAVCDHRELGFVIYLGANFRQNDRFIVRAQRVWQLVKNQRRFGRLSTAFDGVVNVVTPDSNNFAWVNGG